MAILEFRYTSDAELATLYLGSPMEHSGTSSGSRKKTWNLRVTSNSSTQF
jgi:hypothetical protein